MLFPFYGNPKVKQDAFVIAGRMFQSVIGGIVKMPGVLYACKRKKERLLSRK